MASAFTHAFVAIAIGKTYTGATRLACAERVGEEERGE
jgi:hypothetical protein